MNIKKFLFLTTLFAMSVLMVSAQEQQQEETSWKFVPHWYLQLQGGVNETLGEAKFGDLLSPSAQMGLGYQFNPYLGVRLKLSGWQAKGGWVNPEQDYKFNQLGLGVDLRLDLTNCLGGWNPKRLVSVGLFVGGGANLSWNNDEAQRLYTRGHELPYLWDGSKIRPVAHGGLDVNFRLSDRVDLGLETNAHVLNDHFNSKKAGNADWMFNALLGVKIALGKTAQRVEPVVEPVSIVPTVTEKPKEPTKPVVKEPQKQEVKPQRIDVFFEIRSAEIRSAEMAKINELLTFLQENPHVRVDITGYADRETGNATINQQYSAERAAAVKDVLLKAGVAENRITTAAKGDTEQPFAENDRNRVCICVTE